MTLTRVQIASVHTGSTEQETQIIIDELQRMGWNVTWGTGPSQFCSWSEERAFWKDFRWVMYYIKYLKIKEG